MRIRTLAAAAVISLGLPLAVSAPAQAGVACNLAGICGRIRHYSPDTGYDPPILIMCNWGHPATQHFLWEGESSTKYCKDTDMVYNYAGDEIACRYSVPRSTRHRWVVMFARPGWTQIHDNFNAGSGCVVRKA